MADLSVNVQSETAMGNEAAYVEIYDAEGLQYRINAKLVSLRGADGGMYPRIRLEAAIFKGEVVLRGQ